MRLSSRHKRNLRKVIPFALMWGVFGLLYVIIEYGLLGSATEYPSTKNPYNFDRTALVTPLVALLMGSILGTVEMFLLNKLFVNRPFWIKILFKTGVYVASIIFMLVLISAVVNSTRLGVSPFDPAIVESIGIFIGNFAFWSIVIYAGFMILISLYVSETSDYLGGSVFSNFFTGKYHRPVEEERIFMFLDMRSSTTIAEKLGHLKYFNLLNRYYADTTDPILDTLGEVYQYAGDEIIVSWNLKTGLKENNCVQCFFKVQEAFRKATVSYMATYGLVPTFKAGFHVGAVTTGEIGVLKKELFFTGDVLNTAARIQGMCNELGADILVSEDLISQLDLAGQFTIVKKGSFALRGKQGEVNLFTVSLEKPQDREISI